jgi:hypothetical protein
MNDPNDDFIAGQIINIRTPLSIAVQLGWLDCIRLLLTFNANANKGDPPLKYLLDNKYRRRPFGENWRESDEKVILDLLPRSLRITYHE